MSFIKNKNKCYYLYLFEILSLIHKILKTPFNTSQKKLWMPKRKRELLGITAAILGCILSAYGGANLGKKVEWWGGYLTDKVEAVYDNRNSLYSLEELEQESRYIQKIFISQLED